MPVNTQEECRALAHDLAQPVSALQCALEVALMRPRANEDYRTVLEESLQLAQQMDCRLRQVRERSGSPRVETSLAAVVAALMEELQPAASLLETVLQSRCEAYPVEGDGEELRAALSSLLHDAIAKRSNTSIVIRGGDRVVGSIHVRPPYREPGGTCPGPEMQRKWIEGFRAANAGCEVRQTDRGQVVEVRFSAHRQDALMD